MHRDSSLIQGPRLARRGLPVLAALALICMVGGRGAFGATQRPTYLGRPLVEVLRLLEKRGLRVIFSSAVVDDRTVVTVEPGETGPRAILEEILAPLGLTARDGPRGTIQIVRASGAELMGILRGRVLSTSRGAPIVGASVKVEGTEAQATTHPDGTFQIRDVKAGTYDVVIEAHGFLPRTVTNVRVRPRATRGLDVRMQAKPSYLEEIVVTPSRLSLVQEEQTSFLAAGDDDAVLVPTFGGDVSRIVELLPGVASPDNSAAFYARGSQAKDVSYVLDGLELYEPFHLLKFQSPFSFVDTDIVDRVDFIDGAFTADFGDRHGGLVKVSTWAPADPHHTRIVAGSLNSRVTHGGPTPGGAASWLASARVWYPGSFWDSIELGESGLEPRFGDAYLSFSFNASPRTVLSAHGLLAYDKFEFEESGGDETVDASSRSGYFWLRALNSWPGGMVSESILSTGRIERVRRGLSEPEDELLTVNDDRVMDFIGVKHDATWLVSNSHLFRAGVEARRLDAEYDYTSGPEDDAASRTTTRLDPSGTSIGGYIAHRAAITSNFATELGLRYDRQSHTDENQVSPRVNAIWRLGARSEARLGLGQYYQSQRLHELNIEDGETSFLPAELSRQVSLTFQHRFPKDLRIRFDAYYRKLTRLHPRYENLFNPIELYPETEMDRVLVAADHARLRGVELLLRTAPGDPFNWWVSYAWSSAEDVIEGRGVPRNWDQTHAGKFLVGYHHPDRWSVSLSGTAHTGWPTTPATALVTTLPGGATQIDPVIGSRNSDRFPWYVRFDFKTSWSFHVPGGGLRVDFEVLNLANKQNACCVDDYFFTPRSNGSVDVDRELGYWLGRTPSLWLVWEF